MNLGIFDRLIRLVFGLGLVFFDYVATPNWELIFFGLGSWGVFTSVFGWCPLYGLMGVETCPTKFKVVENVDV